ncbi:hypothetical protein ACIQWS_05290 [Phyllobacterium sp. NPDC097923]|uniref:hypothetical protein n=1 Tax=Phyllobacterium sp. NPDC097923 TaxID=3364404 RepID=UPI00383A8970
MVRHKRHKIGASKSPFVLAGFARNHPVCHLPVGIAVDIGVEQQPPAFGAARIGGWSVLAARILDGFVKRLRNRMPAGIPKHETRMSITDAGKIGRLKRLSDLVTRQDRDLLAVFLADILPMRISVFLAIIAALIIAAAIDLDFVHLLFRRIQAVRHGREMRRYDEFCSVGSIRVNNGRPPGRAVITTSQQEKS